MASCTSDVDCRRDEGYVCDREWHACSLPNLAAIVAKHCPGPTLHDPAFGDAEPWATGTEPSGAVRDAGFVALVTTSTGVAFAPDAPTATGHDVVLAHADHYYAAWRDAEAIELAVSSDGVAWGAPHPVQADDGSPLGAPLLAAGKGVLYVMYGEGTHGLRVRTSHDGGATFVATTTPLAGAYGNAVVDDTGGSTSSRLNGDDHGGYGSAMQRIEYASSKDGETFTSPLVVSGRDEMLPTYFANPSIASMRAQVALHRVRPRRPRCGMGRRDRRDPRRRQDLDAAHARRWLRDPPRAEPRARSGHRRAARRLLRQRRRHRPVRPRELHGRRGEVHAVGRDQHAAVRDALARARRQQVVGDRESLFVDAKRRVLHALWAQPVVENDAIVTRVFHASAKLR